MGLAEPCECDECCDHPKTQSDAQVELQHRVPIVGSEQGQQGVGVDSPKRSFESSGNLWCATITGVIRLRDDGFNITALLAWAPTSHEEEGQNGSADEIVSDSSL